MKIGEPIPLRWYAAGKIYGNLWAPDKNGKWRNFDIKGNYNEYVMYLIRRGDRILCLHCEIPADLKDPKIMPHRMPWLVHPTPLIVGWGYYGAYFNERSDPILMPKSFKPETLKDTWRYRVIKHVFKPKRGR